MSDDCTPDACCVRAVESDSHAHLACRTVLREVESLRTQLAEAREEIHVLTNSESLREGLLTGERDRFAAQLDAWRPVVEAAKAWRSSAIGVWTDETEAKIAQACDQLIAAVDALPRGGRSHEPARPAPGGEK